MNLLDGLDQWFHASGTCFLNMLGRWGEDGMGVDEPGWCGGGGGGGGSGSVAVGLWWYHGGGVMVG